MASLPTQPGSPPQLRRKPKMAELARSSRGSSARSGGSPAPTNPTARSRPYLPTYREAVFMAVFPALLLFGALFSLLSPNGRAGVAGAAHFHAHAAGSAPTYFARKDNVLNVFFVKRGWFWVSLAFAQFVVLHPAFRGGPSGGKTSSSPPPPPLPPPSSVLLGRRASAVLRWGLVTAWWVLVTQWCFGPPLIDRSFRLTGGGCRAEAGLNGVDGVDGVDGAAASLAAVVVAAACKRSGGRWSGGHDISGHVFLLVLGTTFLAQEVGWVLLRARGRGRPGGGGGGDDDDDDDDRTIVMADGAVKSAAVEAGTTAPAPSASAAGPAMALSLRVVGTVVALSLWMLLMTTIYFHTWPEKLSGLLVALTGLYGVYVVPRFVPAVRRVVGLPGL